MNESEKIRERIFHIECADKIVEPEKTELEMLKRKLNEMESVNTLDVVAAVNQSNEKLELIKRTICNGASDDELKLFLMTCERTGLDPFSRQIYSVPYGKKRSVQVSIDGFRLIAQRSGLYGGQTPTQWCGSDGIWHDVWVAKDLPVAAKVGVIRKDFSEPLYAVAKFGSYAYDAYGNLQPMWKKMSDHMIAKVAECLALRKAFPQELSGIYSLDEMSSLDPVTSFEEKYEGTREQKKILVERLHQLGLQKHPNIQEDYKFYSEKVSGVKMSELDKMLQNLMESKACHH